MRERPFLAYIDKLVRVSNIEWYSWRQRKPSVLNGIIELVGVLWFDKQKHSLIITQWRAVNDALVVFVYATVTARGT